MDKKILEEYIYMKEEIKDLKKRISKDREKLATLENMVVTDSVTCGRKGRKPIRVAKVTGRPVRAINQRMALIKRRVDKLERLELELETMTNQVEEFISTIEKSELRTMFRLYYIDDLTWVQVAHRMNNMFPKKRKRYTEDSCRMRNERFLKKV